MKQFIIVACICFVAIVTTYFIRVSKNPYKIDSSNAVVEQEEEVVMQPEETANSTFESDFEKIVENTTIASNPEKIVENTIVADKPEKAALNTPVVEKVKTQPTLKEITEKFNNCSYVKWIPEGSGGKFKMYAIANGNTSISIKYDYIEDDIQKQMVNTFNLDNNILSIELRKDVTTEEEIGKLLVSSMKIQWLIDSVGQVYGYADGIVAEAANTNKEPTLEKNGWNSADNGNSIIFKMDISKKPVF